MKPNKIIPLNYWVVCVNSVNAIDPQIQALSDK